MELGFRRIALHRLHRNAKTWGNGWLWDTGSRSEKEKERLLSLLLYGIDCHVPTVEEVWCDGVDELGYRCRQVLSWILPLAVSPDPQ